MTHRSQAQRDAKAAISGQARAALFGGEEAAGLLATLFRTGPACTPADAETFTGPENDEIDRAQEQREDAAKAMCASCPARSACLDYALAVKPTAGVWAGYTADEISDLLTAEAA
ncbi:WhiB family transcriptional regulator [Bailinhaonella thermotolerans]|uniref:WhiB family transcriptional regulator n=1 Tax=Bailinhaonella thermotolerans TaxID=1070861 RepID=A0A3A4ARP9_9ACTN|nr:WhiB family transcriptional regulator [Bailinhaonella thermotolerans]RJL29944.1 WhiB family transcriptional regulator [Bailinhaonella thermotolerans]